MAEIRGFFGYQTLVRGTTLAALLVIVVLPTAQAEEVRTEGDCANVRYGFYDPLVPTGPGVITAGEPTSWIQVGVAVNEGDVQAAVFVTVDTECLDPQDPPEEPSQDP